MMVMIWHLALQLPPGNGIREGWRSRLKKLVVGRKKLMMSIPSSQILVKIRGSVISVCKSFLFYFIFYDLLSINLQATSPLRISGRC
jgi:hypothetical protein